VRLASNPPICSRLEAASGRLAVPFPAENVPGCTGGFDDAAHEAGGELAAVKTPVVTGGAGGAFRGGSITASAADACGSFDGGDNSCAGSGSSCGLGTGEEIRGEMVRGCGAGAIKGRVIVRRASEMTRFGGGAGANKGMMTCLTCRTLSGVAVLKINTPKSTWARALASNGERRTGACWPMFAILRTDPFTSVHWFKVFSTRSSAGEACPRCA